MARNDLGTVLVGLGVAVALAAPWMFQRDPSDLNVALFATLPPLAMALLLWARPSRLV